MPIALFDQLLSKEMTRREFLLHLGFLVLAITGITGLLKTASNPNLLTTNRPVSTGFGAGPYGGKSKKV